MGYGCRQAHYVEIEGLMEIYFFLSVWDFSFALWTGCGKNSELTALEEYKALEYTQTSLTIIIPMEFVQSHLLWHILLRVSRAYSSLHSLSSSCTLKSLRTSPAGVDIKFCVRGPESYSQVGSPGTCIRVNHTHWLHLGIGISTSFCCPLNLLRPNFLWWSKLLYKV